MWLDGWFGWELVILGEWVCEWCSVVEIMVEVGDGSVWLGVVGWLECCVVDGCLLCDWLLDGGCV